MDNTTKTTNDLHTPGALVPRTFEQMQQGDLWLSSKLGEYFLLARKFNGNVEDCLIALANINHLHPSVIQDHTYRFYWGGRKQPEVILDTLINGNVQPLDEGFLFFVLADSTHTHIDAVFVSDEDERLTSIKIARNNVILDLGHGRTPLSYEQILNVMNFSEV